VPRLAASEGCSVLGPGRFGRTDAANRIIKGLETTIGQKVVTYDSARLTEGAREVKGSEFATAIIDDMRRL
jgi:isocitrate dehydrogenase